MNLQEAYSALGIADGSTKEEAKKAFKKLAAKHHPDKSDGNADLFKKINEAYQVIEKGRDFGPTQAPQQSYNHQDIFNDFMRQAGANPFGGFSRQKKQIHAEDKTIHLNITFQEAVLGCKKKLNYHRNVRCEPCGGNGNKRIHNGCKVCDGSGVQTRQQGNVIVRTSCSSCHGAAKIESCSACKENGYVDSDTNVEVNIPGGVNPKEGKDTVVLQGVGDYAGELFGSEIYTNIRLILNVDNNTSLKIEGNDVVATCIVTLLDALKGCKKTVETVDGWTEITVPSGTKNKEEILLANLGVNRVGNERIVLSVEYPADTSKLIEALSELE